MKNYGDLGFNEIATYKIGETFYKLGKKEDASKILNKFVADYPNSKYKKKVIKILSKL
jgi:TolA-binding protein